MTDDKLDVDGLRSIPVTVKRDLIERREDFRCDNAAPYLTSRTRRRFGRERTTVEFPASSDVTKAPADPPAVTQPAQWASA